MGTTYCRNTFSGIPAISLCRNRPKHVRQRRDSKDHERVLEFQVKERDARVQISMNVGDIQAAHYASVLTSFFPQLIPPPPLWTKNSASRSRPGRASAIPAAAKCLTQGIPW